MELLRTNPAGTMVAALACSRKHHRRDPRVFVFSTSGGGTLHTYDLSADGRCPVTLAWDLADPRMLVVQTQVGIRQQHWCWPAWSSCAAAHALLATGS